ncbi:YfdX family protein, partial [Klebsiella pneumoniae]|uniref:YfdX family protein n=1 Tax=Klebsiella pneumoniae TaxID=573 RepID=UPI00272F700C
IALSEGYVGTPEKVSAIQSANEKMAKGDQKGAIDTRRLAGIGVIESHYLSPLKHTRMAVEQAQEMREVGKYDEANLGLKGVDE